MSLLNVERNVHCITVPVNRETSRLTMIRDLQLQGGVCGEGLQPTGVFTDSEKTSVLYYGQLKLFISELEFLTPFYSRDDITVLYAGASLGYHILYLVDLFPKMQFILVDPDTISLQKMTPSIIKDLKLQTSYENVMSRITFINKVLTESEESETHVPIKSLRQVGREMLFISDIRNPIIRDASGDETMHQCIVHADMELQRRLLLQLDPEQSLLKCRMPWTLLQLDDGSHVNHRKYTYLQCSHIRYQVYTSPQSHETRMLVTRDDAKNITCYDGAVYEQAMQNFQINTRRTIHIEPMEDEYDIEIRRLKDVRYVSMFLEYNNSYFVPMPTEKMFQAYEAVHGQLEPYIRCDGVGMKRFNINPKEFNNSSYDCCRSAWLSSLCCCYDCIAFDHVAKQYAITSGLGPGCIENILTRVPLGIRLFKWMSNHVC